MIEIKIAESYTTDNPEDSSRYRSQYDMFVEGFQKLCATTGMHNISVDGFRSCPIVSRLNFDDGSAVGINALFQQLGFDINSIKRKYN